MHTDWKAQDLLTEIANVHYDMDPRKKKYHDTNYLMNVDVIIQW